MDWVKRHAVAVGTVLTSALFLALVHSRILSYVCGNDPMLYMRAAQVLLNPEGFSRTEWVHTLTFVAPGYPLLLAGALWLFGPFAPYWVNLVLLTAALPLLWFVLRRLTGTDRAAALSLLGLLLLVFRGHEYNAPAMLFPFREPARLLFVFGAYALAVKGLQGGLRRGPLLAAGLASLAACFVREPSILVLPGLVLGVAGLTSSWRERLRASGWLLAPWIAVGVAGGVVVHRLAFHGSQQMAVVKYLTDTHGAMIRARLMLDMIPEEAGWVGVGLIAIGLARALRRAPVLWAWFLLPAVLFFVFHCFMQVHVRYFLTSLLFVSVFAGYGLDGVIGWLGRFTGRRWERLLALLVFLAAAALMAQTIRQAHPWEPRVSKADVRAWQASIRELPKGADGRARIVVEQRCRYLEDLLLSYSNAQLLDAREVERWPASWEPATYFQPLNRLAEYPKPEWLFDKKIYAHRILTDRFDLWPVDPEVRTLGRGDYAMFQVRSWQAGRHEQPFAVAAGEDQLVWMDWGACPSGTQRRVSIRNADTGQVWWEHVVSGSGLQAVWLAGEMVKGTAAVFACESSEPVPALPVVEEVGSGQTGDFTMGVDRRVSTGRWFPSLGGGRLDLWPVSLKADPLEFVAPVLHGSAEASWEILFFGDGRGEAPISVCCNLVDKTAPMGDVAWHITDRVVIRGGERVQLRRAEEEGAPTRLRKIQFQIRQHE